MWCKTAFLCIHVWLCSMSISGLTKWKWRLLSSWLRQTTSTPSLIGLKFRYVFTFFAFFFLTFGIFPDCKHWISIWNHAHQPHNYHRRTCSSLLVHGCQLKDKDLDDVRINKIIDPGLGFMVFDDSVTNRVFLWCRLRYVSSQISNWTVRIICCVNLWIRDGAQNNS